MNPEPLLQTPTPVKDAGNIRDPYRPQVHYLPPSGWINDPNGLIYWQGQYHLFFQHNLHEARWNAISWAHAVSDDLVHWRHLPTALVPDRSGPDASGVWSGCAVADGDELKLVRIPVNAAPDSGLMRHPNMAVCGTSESGHELRSF